MYIHTKTGDIISSISSLVPDFSFIHSKYDFLNPLDKHIQELIEETKEQIKMISSCLKELTTIYDFFMGEIKKLDSIHQARLDYLEKKTFFSSKKAKYFNDSEKDFVKDIKDRQIFCQNIQERIQAAGEFIYFFKKYEKENKFEVVHQPLDVSQISNDMLQELGEEFKKIVQKLWEYEQVLKTMKGCLEREIEFYKSKLIENKEERMNYRSPDNSKTLLDLKLSLLQKRRGLIEDIKERIGRGEKLKFYAFHDEQEVEKH